MIKRLDSRVGATHPLQVNPFLVTSEDQISTKYKARIWGDIDGTEDFMYIIDVLESAKENDLVELHINSYGGDVDATMTLIHAMQKCSAEIHVVMTGTVGSCGTLPMFFCDSWEAGEFTSFMFHDFIIGLPAQTASASKAMGEHYFESSKNTIRKIYRGFFTEEELQLLLSGKQYWLTPEDVSARYKKRMELLEQEDNNEEGETIEEIPNKCSGTCSCNSTDCESED